MTLVINTPDDFNYRNVLDSHGWRQLAPFAYDNDRSELSRVHQLSDGAILRLRITDQDGSLSVQVDGDTALSSSQFTEIESAVRRMFCVDWELSEFYNALEQHPGYEWVQASQQGRMLISPSVWEDLVKTLLTTNTTWSQTINMVERFSQFGVQDSAGSYAFPTPEMITQLSLDEFAEQLRAGYRSPYIHELAIRITSGELDVEAWYDSDVSSDALYKEIKSLKGFGDYSAGTMLRLLGHFDRIAIDSVCRNSFRKVTGIENASDKEITVHYSNYGEWQGLVMWMDVIQAYSE